MSKNKHNSDKNNHNSDRNKNSPLEIGAVSLDRNKRIDISAYEKKYPGKKFCVINQMHGEVEKYIDRGFEPVKHSNRTDRVFEGLTDKETGWAKWVVGTGEGGQPMHAYLLMIDEDAYDDIIINPQKKRNLDIRTAMGLAGKRGEADASARNGSNIETYAPFNPTGGKGLDIESTTVPKFNTLT